MKETKPRGFESKNQTQFHAWRKRVGDIFALDEDALVSIIIYQTYGSASESLDTRHSTWTKCAPCLKKTYSLGASQETIDKHSKHHKKTDDNENDANKGYPTKAKNTLSDIADILLPGSGEFLRWDNTGWTLVAINEVPDEDLACQVRWGFRCSPSSVHLVLLHCW